MPIPIDPTHRAARDILLRAASDLSSRLTAHIATDQAHTAINSPALHASAARCAPAAQIIMDRQPPDETLLRDRDTPYLDRWHLHRDPLGHNVYLHHILTSDLPVPHCHPWPSASLLLWGILDERWRETGTRGPDHLTTHRAGDVVLRSAALTHQLLLPPPPAPPPVTLFVTARKERDWGFWPSDDNSAHARFVPWRDFRHPAP